MNKNIFAILASFVAITLHAQDTTYFDANDKIVASLALADYYNVASPDSESPRWTKELGFYKSGKIRSEATLSNWKKASVNWRFERVYKEWYESGKLHKEIGFSAGMLNGNVISYWENGNIKHDGFYVNGLCKKGKNYNSDGSEVADGPYRKMAEYPGGSAELDKYIHNNFVKVIQDRDTSYSGKLNLVFMVNKDGSASFISVEKKVTPWISEIGMKAVNSMPKWQPAVRDAEYYSSRRSVSIEVRKKNDNSPYSKVEQVPDFPGGTLKMMQFLDKNVYYPKSAQIEKVQGMVILAFIISEEGDIDHIQVRNGIHPDCDAEAIRVVKLMPRWIPGKQDGKAVPVHFTLPIRFALR